MANTFAISKGSPILSLTTPVNLTCAVAQSETIKMASKTIFFIS